MPGWREAGQSGSASAEDRIPRQYRQARQGAELSGAISSAAQSLRPRTQTEVRRYTQPSAPPRDTFRRLTLNHSIAHASHILPSYVASRKDGSFLAPRLRVRVGDCPGGGFGCVDVQEASASFHVSTQRLHSMSVPVR